MRRDAAAARPRGYRRYLSPVSTGARAAALLALLAPAVACATAGYFQLGHGLKAKGAGGAGAALPQDALAAAANPAGMVWVGNRVDLGLEWFRAEQRSRISGNAMGLDGDRDAGSRGFLVPELGYNRMLGDGQSFGVAVFGNGGATRYAENPLAALAGSSSPAGLEFIQGTVAPTYAAKLGANHSLGVSLNLVYQEFEANGFEHFDNTSFSVAPGFVTNRGKDASWGLGWRAGWLGRFSPGVSLAFAYQPRTRMSRFERYKGLLADGGSFDVPEHYVAGAALKPAASVTLLGDVQRINYANVRALGNRAGCFLNTSCLMGTPQGPGAGWRNTTVYKLGLVLEAAPRLTLRAGYAWLKQPIPPGETLLNVFAPAVSERHATLGATWQATPALELTLSFMLSPESRVQGRGSISGGVGGGEADLRMTQRAFGLGLGWKL